MTSSRLFLLILPTFLALSTGAPAAFANDIERLMHNGSEMRMQIVGQDISISYHQPRPGLVAVGVTRGTLLFRGTLTGSRIQGTAFAFKSGCTPASYAVDGTRGFGRSFELTGPGPRFGRGCGVRDRSWQSPHSRLVFSPIGAD